MPLTVEPTDAAACGMSTVAAMSAACGATLSVPTLLAGLVSLAAPVVAVTLTGLLGWVKLIAAVRVVLGATLAGTLGNVTMPLTASYTPVPSTGLTTLTPARPGVSLRLKVRPLAVLALVLAKLTVPLTVEPTDAAACGMSTTVVTSAQPALRGTKVASSKLTKLSISRTNVYSCPGVKLTVAVT